MRPSSGSGFSVAIRSVGSFFRFEQVFRSLGVMDERIRFILLRCQENMSPYASRWSSVRAIIGVYTSPLPSARCHLPVNETRVDPLMRPHIGRVSSCRLPLLQYSERRRILVGAYWPASESFLLVRLPLYFVKRAGPTLPVSGMSDEMLCCGYSSRDPPALFFLGRCRDRVFLCLRYAGVPIRRRGASTVEIMKTVTTPRVRAIW